jgi:hypothetical protein
MRVRVESQRPKWTGFYSREECLSEVKMANIGVTTLTAPAKPSFARADRVS